MGFEVLLGQLEQSAVNMPASPASVGHGAIWSSKGPQRAKSTSNEASIKMVMLPATPILMYPNIRSWALTMNSRY